MHEIHNDSPLIVHNANPSWEFDPTSPTTSNDGLKPLNPGTPPQMPMAQNLPRHHIILQMLHLHHSNLFFSHQLLLK